MFAKIFFRVEPSYNRRGDLVTTKVFGYDLSADVIHLLSREAYEPLLRRFGGWYNKKSGSVSIPCYVSRTEIAGWLEHYYGGENDEPNGQPNAVFVGA